MIGLPPTLFVLLISSEKCDSIRSVSRLSPPSWLCPTSCRISSTSSRTPSAPPASSPSSRSSSRPCWPVIPEQSAIHFTNLPTKRNRRHISICYSVSIQIVKLATNKHYLMKVHLGNLKVGLMPSFTLDLLVWSLQNYQMIWTVLTCSPFPMLFYIKPSLLVGFADWLSAHSAKCGGINTGKCNICDPVH